MEKEKEYELSLHKEEIKAEFSAKLSHDVRTLMNVILGMTSIADTHKEDPEKVSECLQKINASGRHLLILINEVFDLRKIETGKMELTKEELNIHKMVDNLLEIMKPQIDEKKHEITISENDVEHEAIIGDSIHLMQIFVNILANAIRYTPSGGRIHLTITEKKISNPHLGCFEFSFEDNGPGIPDEILEHIFEPFTYVKMADGQSQSKGLGLSIANYMARFMNGSIKAESKVGKGSKFTVTLYLRLQEDEDITFSDYVDAPVLVVDDQKEFCESTCVILEDLGLSGEWVLSGKEAVEKIKEGNQYYAIMLDWKMPEMDGFATAKAIRELVGEAIPIIVLSGYDWLDIEKEAKKAGVNAFISKTAFKSRLIYMLKRMIKANVGEGENPFEKLDVSRFTGKRILIAEDNEINAEIVKEILDNVGINVDIVENGKEAVDAMKASEPEYYSMILMDIQMPEMNGYEASRQIRADGRKDLQNIPIVAMTAEAFAEHVRAAEEAGMNQHIAKPLDIKQIVDVLQKWM